MTKVTENDVARALDGDRDTLTRLVQRVHQPVFRLALRFFGNRADAGDGRGAAARRRRRAAGPGAAHRVHAGDAVVSGPGARIAYILGVIMGLDHRTGAEVLD